MNDEPTSHLESARDTAHSHRRVFYTRWSANGFMLCICHGHLQKACLRQSVRDQKISLTAKITKKVWRSCQMKALILNASSTSLDKYQTSNMESIAIWSCSGQSGDDRVKKEYIAHVPSSARVKSAQDRILRRCVLNTLREWEYRAMFRASRSQYLAPNRKYAAFYG